MNNNPGHTLTSDAAAQIARAIRLVSRFSREPFNVTAGERVLPSYAPTAPTWPLVVTGSPLMVDPSTGDPSDSGSAIPDLWPGKVYTPNPAGSLTPVGEPRWLEVDCWLKPITGESYSTGQKGVGPLTGWKPAFVDADSTVYTARPIYTLLPDKPGSGIYGQDYSTPGSIMIWNDETGQWAGEAHGFRYMRTTSTTNSFPTFGVNSQLCFSLPQNPVPATVSHYSHNTLFAQLSIFDVTRSAGLIFPSMVEGSDKEFTFGFIGRSGLNGWLNTSYFLQGKCVAMTENFILLDAANSGVIRTSVISNRVVRFHKDLDNWQAGFASNGAAGLSTVGGGGCFTEGYFTNQLSAITTLAGGATLADVITKVNEIITKIKTAGITL